MLGDDPGLSRELLVHPIADVWRWHNTEHRVYLVYAMILERIALPPEAGGAQ
jgi:hypothetical protein